MSARARRRRLIGLAYAAAVAAGLASAWAALRGDGGLARASGPWRVSLLAGSADADSYTRARVAVGGLLALSRRETLYYVAREDSSGAPLRSRCTYRVSGPVPDARWWSITAYADDFFLFPDSAHRYSVSGTPAGNQTGLPAEARPGAQPDVEGRYSFVSAPASPPPARRAGAPWLPTPGEGGLVFTFRVYNPGPAIVAAPHALAMPRIERVEACP